MYNPNSINALFTLDKCFHNTLKNGHVFRIAELEAVVKVLSCKTHKLGAKAYGCTNTQCSHEKRVCNTCKSKLCTSCGQKATECWIATINSIFPDCKYRHITFTMPKAFWIIFQYNRALLNHLFSLAANTLISLAKKRDLTVGIFAALHTYGRQINFNCHIHLSIAEFGLNQQGKLKTFFFKFGLLMRQWRYGVISLLRTHYPVLILPPELEAEGNSHQSWNAFLDRNYKSHWNVDIAKNTTHKAHTAKYLGSYVKKPPIAAARLADYTGGDVTFTYLNHRSKSYKNLTLSQTEMILRILNHVPEKHFKMICYFSFLSNHSSILYNARMVFTGFIAGLKVGQLVSVIENIALQRPI